MVALRGILDKDLDPFITNCKRLEQVDLLGVRSISQEVCLRYVLLVSLTCHFYFKWKNNALEPLKHYFSSRNLAM